MPHRLRRLALDDMDCVALILRRAFDERLPWLAGLHTPDEDRSFFRNHVFPNSEVWGADDGELVGFIAFREDWIDHLYVEPGRQKRGVGDALLRVAKSSRSQLRLWTFQKNVIARRFYETRGFVLVKQTDGRDNEEREPDALYQWTAADPAAPG